MADKAEPVRTDLARLKCGRTGGLAGQREIQPPIGHHGGKPLGDIVMNDDIDTRIILTKPGKCIGQIVLNRRGSGTNGDAARLQGTDLAQAMKR